MSNQSSQIEEQHKTSNPTPGPWEWNTTAMIMADGVLGAVPVAAVFDKHWRHMPPEETREANARLIAAAPDLLAALEAIHKGFVDGSIKWTKKRQSEGDPYHPAHTLMSEAMAKATSGAMNESKMNGHCFTCGRDNLPVEEVITPDEEHLDMCSICAWEYHNMGRAKKN